VLVEIASRHAAIERKGVAHLRAVMGLWEWRPSTDHKMIR